MIKKLYYKISIMVKIKREKNKLVKKAKKKDCTIKSFNDLIHKIDEEYLINKAEEENINEKLRLDPPIPECMYID